MSDVSGVGGSHAPTVAGAGNQQTVTPATPAPDSDDYNTGDGEKSVGAVGNSEESGASEFYAQHMSGRRSGMSTEFFLNLHNSAVESASAPTQSAEFDFKKLMEKLKCLTTP